MVKKENIVYSLKNISEKKYRSFLTILSIMVGITTIFVFISFGWGLFNYVGDLTSDSSADKLTIQPKGIGPPGLDDTFLLTENDLKAVEKTNGVMEATGVRFKAVESKRDGEIKFIWAISYDPKVPLIIELSGIDLESGRELRDGDDGKVVLGYNYLIKDKIFSKPLELNDKINLDGEDVRIVGFYGSVGNPQDDSNIYLTNHYYEKLYPEMAGTYNWIVAQVEKDNIDQIALDVEKSLRNSRNLEKGKEDFFVASFEDLLETYTGVLNIIIGFVILIALISIFVSGVNTANTMITSVLERIKEIGIMKSIGARNSEVFKIFLLESGILGFIAGVLGVLLGWGVSSIAGGILETLGWGFFAPYYSWELFAGAIIFATLTGAISGVIPAFNASRINPVEALRYE